MESSISSANFHLEGLPSLYEHYTFGGVKSGLVSTASGFLLNGKPF